MKRRLLYLVIIAMMVMAVTAVYAANNKSLEELEEEQKALLSEMDATLQEQELTEEQRLLADRILADLNETSQAIENDLMTLDIEMDNLRAEKSVKESEILEVQAALDLAKEEEVLYRDQVAKRMKVMYEYGDIGFLQILFESKDLSELFSSIEYISKIFNYDEKMFDQLEESQRAIGAAEASVEVAGFELDAIMEDTETKRSEVEALAEEKGRIKTMIEEAQFLLQIKEQELADAEAEISEQIKAVEKAIEEYNFSWDGGILQWPSPGYEWLTDTFGWRTHPIYGTRTHHNGIDIGVPYGSEIVAVEDGIVISSYYSSSYGNVITIYHGVDSNGDKYYSLYAHNSKLLVSKDDEVKRGDLIAYSGSTGWSTGPHLHFGIKQNDTWIDPLIYYNR